MRPSVISADCVALSRVAVIKKLTDSFRPSLAKKAGEMCDCAARAQKRQFFRRIIGRTTSQIIMLGVLPLPAWSQQNASPAHLPAKSGTQSLAISLVSIQHMTGDCIQSNAARNSVHSEVSDGSIRRGGFSLACGTNCA